MKKLYLSNPEEEVKEFAHKYKFLYSFLGIVFMVFACRLWYLQVFQGKDLRLWSEKNHIKLQKLDAPRGMILDRKGRVIVDNQPGFDVVITPQYAKKLNETAHQIAKILNLEASYIIDKVKTSSKKNGAFKPIIIKEDLNRDEVARIERMRKYHPGLKIEIRIKRTYLMGDNGAQLFGYVGEATPQQMQKRNAKSSSHHIYQGDTTGRSGIEADFDTYLRGKSGMSFVQVDASGREFKSVEAPRVLSLIDSIQEPQPGHSLILTLDKDVQEVAYNSFAKTGRIGSVVVLENKTGKVLAWVNSPSFDPSLFWPKIKSENWQTLIKNPLEPLRNKVIQNHYPPGSTFKVILALAGLQEGLIDTQTTHSCNGSLRLGRRRFYCAKRHGHGELNIVQAIEESCNVFFYNLGMDLGIEKIARYGRSLGIGQKTGIHITGEVSGLMPDAFWKEKTKKEVWQLGETLNTSIGQGFLLTSPLQLASVLSGIANSGPVYKPYIVDKILNAEGQAIQQTMPQLLRDPSRGFNTEVTISKKHYQTLQKGLFSVIHGKKGTARWYKVPGIKAAGKSGTVQLKKMNTEQLFRKCEELPVLQRHHGWFIGYAPFDQPEITIAVFAQNSCSGSRGGAPVFRDIVQAYFKEHIIQKKSSLHASNKLKLKNDIKEDKSNNNLLSLINNKNLKAIP